MLKQLIQFIINQPVTFWLIILGVFIVIILLVLLFKVNFSIVRNEKNELISNYNKILLTALLLVLFIPSLFLLRSSQKPYGVFEQVLSRNSNYIFGIDVSHYQGRIHWADLQQSIHPIKYIFIRATMGKD